MTKDELRALIERHPDRGTLPVDAVLAVCMKESSFREWAIKSEMQYKWLYGDRNSMTVAEKLGQKHSWGLMQVMGGVARELGFTGSFHELWDPAVGLKYGMLKLRACFAKHGNWSDAFAAYNAGTPHKLNGKYTNQDYVDAVLRYWNDFEHQIPLKSTEV